MCFSLKTTTIILTWFQMFYLTVAAVMLSILLNLLETNDNMDDEMEELQEFLSSAFVFLVIWLIIIKTPALIALSWGAAKSKHSFYVPWLIVEAIEIICQLAHIALYNDLFFAAPWSAIGRFSFILILNSIAFLCAYTLYKRDTARQRQETHYD